MHMIMLHPLHQSSWSMIKQSPVTVVGSVNASEPWTSLVQHAVPTILDSGDGYCPISYHLLYENIPRDQYNGRTSAVHLHQVADHFNFCSDIMSDHKNYCLLRVDCYACA